MGQRGAPKGNQNGRKAKVWTQAIERALRERSRVDQAEALTELAKKLLALCDEGDLAALKELGDRLEGKPKQSMDIDAELSGEVSTTITFVPVSKND